MGYTKHTIVGFSWQGIFMVGATGVTALKLIILARLLAPHDFGIYSLVLIALGLSESLTQTGINVTILQSKQTIYYFLNTAWVISIIRGFLIAILMSVLGIFMAWLYSEPQLSFWIVVTALVPIIKGLINPAIITLYRNLNFFRDSVYRFSLIVVECIATIFFAIATHSVNAFIFGLVVAAIFEVAISFIFFRTRPVFEYISSRAKLIFANAKGLSIGAALSYLNDNLDNFLVGRFLGVSQLGFYQNAYALSHKPTYAIAQSLSHSTLPIFSRLATSPERLKRAFVKSEFALLGIMTVLAIPFLLAPEYLVNLLLGEKWLLLAVTLKWLIGAGILHGLANASYSLFIAKQEYFGMNFHRLIIVALFVPLLFFLSQSYGLEGAAAALFFARLLSMPLLSWNIWKTLRI